MVEEKAFRVTSLQDTWRPTDSNNCSSCKHSVWAVGIGQGFFCLNKQKLDYEKANPNTAGFRRWNIPSPKYRCDFYAYDENKPYTSLQ